MATKITKFIKEHKKMTNKQFNVIIELITQLIQAKAKTIEDVIAILKKTKL